MAQGARRVRVGGEGFGNGAAELDEAVHHARVDLEVDRYARQAQAVGVGNALVGERVALGQADPGRGHAAVVGRVQGLAVPEDGKVWNERGCYARPGCQQTDCGNVQICPAEANAGEARALPDDAAVMASGSARIAVPAISGRAVHAGWEEHLDPDEPARKAAVTRFFSVGVRDLERNALVEDWDVTHVLVDRSDPSGWEVQAWAATVGAETLHEDEGYEESGEKEDTGEHHKCECPCCGAPCEACNEADEEDSEEYEDEEDSEEDSEDE